MDRALKERTVGAIVLMVFIVLVVPVFLDGPDNEPAIISETVTLPGQNGQPRKRQTIVLERDRSEPVPAASDDSDSSPTPAPADAAAEVRTPAAPVAAAPAAATPRVSDEGASNPADGTTSENDTRDATAAPVAGDAGAVPSAAEPATSARSTTGMWAVQLGSFSNKDNAERLAGELRSEGYAAFLSRLSGVDGPLHRVRVGPQKDRDSAAAMAARLAADGHRGQVVPHP